MKLIADSGSTNTVWALCQQGNIMQVYETAGINPFHQSGDAISQTLSELKGLPTIDAIYFYGAGCTPEKKGIVANALAKQFPYATIEVQSDLLAAARALLQHTQGIACILGTGSNSCLYNGEIIAQNVSPLGYILGDEGSGAVLGKKFIGDCLKNQLPSQLRQLFFDEYKLTTAEIIDHVYRQAFPNRYLAQFAPFISKYQSQYDYLHQLVLGSFTDFLTRNVLQYKQARTLPISFIGSIAYHFEPTLREALQLQQLQLGSIKKSPIEGLATYHND